YGFNLNEGMTEYFTRQITDKDAQPLNGKVSNRENYPGPFAFVQRMVPMLGQDLVAQQVQLAEIFFGGKLDLLKTHFLARCKAAELPDPDATERWDTFAKALKGDLAKATPLLPPPPVVK